MTSAMPTSLPPPRPAFPLGRGGLRDLGVAGKAWRLDLARERGLPVPAGWVITHETWERMRAQGTVVGPPDQPAYGDPELFAQRLQWRHQPCRLAVRSAFSDEDGAAASAAGKYHTVLGVEGWRARGVADALCAVWASGAKAAGEDGALPGRMDVLLMEMVDAQVAGVAFSAGDGERSHRVNWGVGLADERVAGQAPFETMDLPVDEGVRAAGGGEGEAREAERSPWAARLRILLAQVEALFGETQRWDVEWADDGETCWLLQVRPVTGALLRDDWFTVANHKEILPDLPSHLMSSVMAERAGELFGWYRRVDRGLPDDRPFLELFAGRPRINVSLLCAMMERWGLPSGLVTDSMGGVGPVPQRMRPLRMLRRMPVLMRMGWAQGRAVPRARAQMREWERERVDARGLGLAEALDRFGRCYVELVHGMFGLTAAMAPRLSMLRRAGSLAHHGRRHRTVTTAMYGAMAALPRDLGDRPDAQELEDFLSAFGHRGPFESDIAEPRYRDRVDELVAAARARGEQPGERLPERERPRRSWWQRVKDVATVPVWWQARKPMAVREQFRHEAMKLFDALRHALLEGAKGAVRAGGLPRVDDLWSLSAEEVRGLAQGQSIAPQQMAQRAAVRGAWAATSLADGFRRSDALRPSAEGAGDGASDRWVGMGLAHGVVEGVAWVAAHPDASPPRRGGQPLVLVAPAIEAGWIPAVLAADAVVVEMGGELSHGSILLREVGKPAVTAAAGAHRQLRTGDVVRVDGGTGEVLRFRSKLPPS